MGSSFGPRTPRCFQRIQGSCAVTCNDKRFVSALYSKTAGASLAKSCGLKRSRQGGCAHTLGDPSAVLTGSPSLFMGGPSRLLESASHVPTLPCKSVPHCAQSPLKIGSEPTCCPAMNHLATSRVSCAIRFVTSRSVHSTACDKNTASQHAKSNRSRTSAVVSPTPVFRATA